MRSYLTPILALVAVSVTAAPGLASINLVQNGGFELTTYTVNSQFGGPVRNDGHGSYGGQGVTDWTTPQVTDGDKSSPNPFNLYFFSGKAATVSALSDFPGEKQDLWSSFTQTGDTNGGNFVALDGDEDAASPLQQEIHGLTPGKHYTLTFYWGAAQLQDRTGPTTEQLQVSLGSQTRSTAVLSNPSKGFSGWVKQTFSFLANSHSEVLSFLSVGGPEGLPPVAVLDGVSLTSATPEPASWALMLLGVGGVGAAARRRRGAALAN